MVAGLALAGPAAAERSEGWPGTEPVDGLYVVLLLGGIPLALFVVIIVLTLLPSLMRGESLTPGGPTVEDQWLGGPRASAELAAPDGATSAAGGASGSW